MHQGKQIIAFIIVEITAVEVDEFSGFSGFMSQNGQKKGQQITFWGVKTFFLNLTAVQDR